MARKIYKKCPDCQKLQAWSEKTGFEHCNALGFGAASCFQNHLKRVIGAQERMPDDFKDVLHKNLGDLYEK